MTNQHPALAALRAAVSGKIESGEAEPIVAVEGDGDPSFPGAIGCEWCDAIFATAESADAHACPNFPPVAS